MAAINATAAGMEELSGPVVALPPGRFNAHNITAASLITLIPDFEKATVVQTRSEAVRAKAIAEIGFSDQERNVCRLRLSVTPPLTDLFCSPSESEVHSSKKAKTEHHVVAEQSGSTTAETNSEVNADDPKTIPLALVGCVWKHYGKQILKSTFEIADESHVDILYTLIYDRHFRAMDASFHGIPLCECTKRKFYSALTFANLIDTMDPLWNGGKVTDNRRSRLMDAVKFARDFISDKIRTYEAEHVLTVETVSKALKSRPDTKRVIFLERFVPWRDALYQLEEEEKLSENELVLWVCFQDDRTGEWRATAPASKKNRFENRALLDESLRGLRDEQLTEKIEIETPAFVHHSGFTCGAKTRESILKLIEFNK